MMHLSMNPDYFEGTVVEDAAERLLAEPSRQATLTLPDKKRCVLGLPSRPGAG